MKYCLCVAFILLIASPFHASSAEIWGAGARSCGEWIENRKKNNDIIYMSWIQGFISSYNLYVYTRKNPNGILGNADHNAIAVWMDNYCQSNPLNTLGVGTVDLIDDLKSRAN